MIQLNHIKKIFNKGKPQELVALTDIDLRMEEGQFLVLIGSNGSGKTSLLNLIAGADFPTEGQVYFDNSDVTRLPEHRRSRWIARVFQDPLSGTAPELSILDNFRLASLRTGKKKLGIGINEGFKKKVRDQISILGMGLENKVEQPMGSLSGGQRQALTLLMSVMDNTQILLLDEPTAALDHRSARLILQTADRLIRNYRLTTLLITHNLKDALAYGTRLIQLDEGRIVRDLDQKAKSQLSLPTLLEWFN
jgi:putative tryptophan/tyrosine transport system ATP-binding protein